MDIAPQGMRVNLRRIAVPAVMKNGRPACFVRDSPPGCDPNPGPALETSAFRRSRDGRAPMPGHYVDAHARSGERAMRLKR
jgi:hypothetical protein